MRRSIGLAALAFAAVFVGAMVLLLLLFGEQTPADRSLRGFFYDFPRVTIGGTRHHANGVEGWLYVLASALPAGLVARAVWTRPSRFRRRKPEP